MKNGIQKACKNAAAAATLGLFLIGCGGSDESVQARTTTTVGAAVETDTEGSAQSTPAALVEELEEQAEQIAELTMQLEQHETTGELSTQTEATEELFIVIEMPLEGTATGSCSVVLSEVGQYRDTELTFMRPEALYFGDLIVLSNREVEHGLQVIAADSVDDAILALLQQDGVRSDGSGVLVGDGDQHQGNIHRWNFSHGPDTTTLYVQPVDSDCLNSYSVIQIPSEVREAHLGLSG